MSEGTLDQLYLALRLAALDLRRAAGVDLPFVEVQDIGDLGIDAHMRPRISQDAAIDALRSLVALRRAGLQ